MEKKLSRRNFLRLASAAGGAAALSACTPQVVTQIVRETEMVREVVKETQMVDRLVTATAAPMAEVKPVVVRFMTPTWASTTDTRLERQIAFRSVIESFNTEYADKGWSVEEIPFDGDSVQLTQQIEQKGVEVLWFNHSEYITRSRAGQLLALDPYLNGEDEKFFPWVQETQRSSDDKQTYALWHNTDTPLYYYNSEKIPNPPKTWSELVAMAREVRAKEGGNKYGFVHPIVGWIQMNSGLFLAQGGEYLDESGKPVLFEGENREILANMFAHYKLLFDEDLIPAGAANQDQTQMMPDIYAGNVYSFVGNSNFHLRQLKPNLPAEEYAKWKAVPLPYPDEAGKGIYQAGGWMIGAAATDDPDLAAASAAFVIHATNESSLAVTNKAGAWIPTRSAILENDPLYTSDAFMQATLNALQSGHVVPLAPIWGPMSAAIGLALQKVVTGEMTIDAALDEAAATTQKEYDALQ